MSLVITYYLVIMHLCTSCGSVTIFGNRLLALYRLIDLSVVLSAPEVLGPEAYDISCDMWSIGVITYIL